MRRFLRDNGLAVVMFGMFLVFLWAQSLSGYAHHNNELTDHRLPNVTYGEYVLSGHFFEAVFENWESEFLQMSFYVILTVFLFQRGSSESKPIDQEDPVDADPRTQRDRPGAPWPVRRGGLALKIYENSLSLALALIFVLSFVLHAASGAHEFSEDQVQHGEEPVSFARYLTTSRFWFESFQNWQSEFLAVGTLVVLSVFLRQRGSPESKPVAAPHRETGTE